MIKFNPTELATLQDQIISKTVITSVDALGFIKQLNEYWLLTNVSLFGINVIAKNNLSIRQNFILARLYYVAGNVSKSNLYATKGASLFQSMIYDGFYVEGYSYYKYVDIARQFYYKNVSCFPGVNITLDYNYAKIAAPDGRVPTTDTHYEDVIRGTIGTYTDLITREYSIHRRGSSYVFINHVDYLNAYSMNLHVNYEFGHFCIYSNGAWQLIHPWYCGYGNKANSPIKNSWNNNIISNGLRTLESWWRYLPFKSVLKHAYAMNTNGDYVHIFLIGKIKRKLTVTQNSVIVEDTGGSHSNFNLATNYSYINLESVSSKSSISETVGYDCISGSTVETHKRLKTYGYKVTFKI